MSCQTGIENYWAPCRAERSSQGHGGPGEVTAALFITVIAPLGWKGYTAPNTQNGPLESDHDETGYWNTQPMISTKTGERVDFFLGTDEDG